MVPAGAVTATQHQQQSSPQQQLNSQQPQEAQRAQWEDTRCLKPGTESAGGVRVNANANASSVSVSAAADEEEPSPADASEAEASEAEASEAAAPAGGGDGGPTWLECRRSASVLFVVLLLLPLVVLFPPWKVF